MKVEELIKMLSQMPIDALVLVDGYEDGLSDPSPPELISVNLNVNREEYYGPHSKDDQGQVRAVVLHRKPNFLS